MPSRTSKYPPKTLVNLQEVKIFAATFVDGQQIADTRFVAIVGDSIHFLHPEGVDTKIRQPAGWLKEAIKAKIMPPPAPEEEDDVQDLPMEGTEDEEPETEETE